MKRSLALARQGRQPTGLLGQVVARIMAMETRAANLVALETLDLAPDDRLLEVGSGHGRTLASAAEIITRGQLAGVDPSEVMRGIAQRRNAKAVRSGRMTLALGSSDQLPFDDNSFNKAVAVHTVYFWTVPERDLRELRRVIEPGGRLVLGYRPAEDAAFVRDFPREIYHIRSRSEIEALVRQAGFSGVETRSRPVGPATMCWTSAR
jgi:ubiquinone/menaquinone biosynthesis C-methylase UbiE